MPILGAFMSTPTATRRPATAARLSGWRAVLARAAAMLLLLNILLPLPAIASAATDGGMVICTAEGPRHLPNGTDGDGKGSHPAQAAGEHCPLCRLSSAAPVLPVPDFVVHTPQSIVETIARIGNVTPMPKPAHPPGSLAARAPPTSI